MEWLWSYKAHGCAPYIYFFPYHLPCQGTSKKHTFIPTQDRHHGPSLTPKTDSSHPPCLRQKLLMFTISCSSGTWPTKFELWTLPSSLQFNWCQGMQFWAMESKQKHCVPFPGWTHKNLPCILYSFFPFCADLRGHMLKREASNDGKSLGPLNEWMEQNHSLLHQALIELEHVRNTLLLC